MQSANTRGLEKRLAAASGVRKSFPADYFANAFYQDASGAPAPVVVQAVPLAVQAEYAALRDEHPTDPVYLALYARASIGSNTQEAIPRLTALSFPPALLELARIYSSPKFQDKDKLRTVFEAYVKVCAASPAIYDYVRPIADASFARDHAAQLRQILQGRTDTESLRLNAMLWTMEFKSVPLAKQGPLRDRVKADAARLRELGPDNLTAMKSLSYAYALLGDSAGQQWISQNAPAASPSAAIEANHAINKWLSENQPGGKAPTEEQLRQQLTQSDEWVKRWPNELEPLEMRFRALAQLPDSPRDELARVAEQWIRLYELRGSSGYPPYPLYLDIARVYANRDIHPDQVGGLIEKQVREVLDAVDSPRSDLQYDLDASGLMGLNSKWNTLRAAAELYIELRRFDAARSVLAKFGASIANRQADVVEYRYWNLMAQLARGENHPLDALTYERNAIAANRRDMAIQVREADQADFNARHAKIEADRTAEARALWKTLGGSDEAFQDWLNMPSFAPPPEPRARTAERNPWKPLNKPLADFRVADIQGKTWRLQDFKGKVTFVNLWATWCVPCREELPYVQRLYDQLRDSGGMAVITLNMDENTGLIEPFMKEHNFTFPALPAFEYVRGQGLNSGLPSTWIVGTDGTILEQRVGAGLSDHWLDDMVAQMQKASGKP